MKQLQIKTNIFEHFNINITDGNEIEIFSIEGSGEKQLMNQLITNIIQLNDDILVHVINIIPQFDVTELIKKISDDTQMKRIKIYDCYNSFDEIIGVFKILEYVVDKSVVIINSITQWWRIQTKNASMDYFYSVIHQLSKRIPIIYFRQNDPSKAQMKVMKHNLVDFYSFSNSSKTSQHYENTIRFVIQTNVLKNQKLHQSIFCKNNEIRHLFVVSSDSFTMVPLNKNIQKK